MTGTLFDRCRTGPPDARAETPENAFSKETMKPRPRRGFIYVRPDR